MNTLNKIVQIFNNWQEQYPVINTFIYSNIYDITDIQDIEYPLMVVDTQTSTNINITNNVIAPTYTFNILFLDRYNQNNNTLNQKGYYSSNVGDIASDTYQYALDFVNDVVYAMNKAGIYIAQNTSPIITKIEDDTHDKIYGQQLELVIEVRNMNCLNNFNPSNCRPARVTNSTGSLNETIQSGATLELNDITVELGDNITLNRPAAVNLNLEDYYVLVFKEPGIYFPANPPVPSGNFIPWLTVNNATTNTGTITATDNNGGAYAYLTSSGGFEVTAWKSNTSSLETGIGLKFSAYGYDKSSCAFVILGNGEIYINNTLVHTGTPSGISDMKIRVEGLNVTFYVNDILQYTGYLISNNTGARGYMIFNPILPNTGDTLNDIKITFI